MELSVKGKDLAGAVAAVSRFAPDKAPLPVLSCVKLTARTGELELRATNLDQSIAVVIPAEVKEDGSAAVSSKLFLGQAQALSDRDVSLKSHGEFNVEMREAKGSRVRLSGMAVTDFPEMLEVADGVPFTFNAKNFAQAVRRTSFAAATDKNRYQLAGLRLKAADGVVSLTATDGHRLAYLPVPTESVIPEAREAILPADALKTLADLLADQDGDVVVMLGASMVGATFGSTRFSGRMIEGQYPNVEGVMNDVLKGERRYTVKVAELAEVVKRAMLLSAGPVKLSFDMGGTLLTVRLRGTDAGGDGDFPVVIQGTGDSSDLSIGVNGRYLLDGLAQAAESVTLVLIDSKHPLGMVGVGAPNYVVMPMTIGD